MRVEISYGPRDPQRTRREAAPVGSLLLYGASGYALAMAMVLRHDFAPALAAETIAFVDDFAAGRGEALQDVPILSFENCRRTWPDVPFIVSVGAPRDRRRLVGRIEAAGARLLSFYEDRPSCLFPAVAVGAGCFIGPNTYIGPKTIVGAHAQIMSNCSIGHDVAIGAFCTICPSCTVSGYVVIEDGVFLGAGTTIVNGRRAAPLRIGRGAVVWAGSVVTTDVPPGATFAGNPAVPTREAAVTRRDLRALRTHDVVPKTVLRSPSAGPSAIEDAPAPLVRATTVERIPVCKPSLPILNDLAARIGHIDASRRYSNHGDLAISLQDRLHALVGTAADVVLAASGTSALTGAILAAAGRPRAGRELCLVPAYTFIGTISAIEQAGYRPHFVDVDEGSWMLDAERLIEHELIGAVGLVVPVAPYGRPVPQAPWLSFGARAGIPVVIDGAASFESLLAAPDTYAAGVPVAVSFHATKVFCTAEGGAVFTGDAATWRATMQCLNFGYDLDRTCRRPAINGKMSEYHAAIGLAELDGWPAKRAKFADVAARYRAGAPSHDTGRLHLAPSLAANYALLETRGSAQADRIGRALQRAGIGWRRWYGFGAHRQPYCLRFGRDETPVTDDLAARLLGLPMSVDLGHEGVDEVLAVIAAIVVQERGSGARAP